MPHMCVFCLLDVKLSALSRPCSDINVTLDLVLRFSTSKILVQSHRDKTVTSLPLQLRGHSAWH